VSVRVENGNVFINESQVIITDIVGTNGVIHVIDAVLLPSAEEVVEVPTETIVDIAVADGRFTTLVAALTAADLAGTLSGDGPFTVFAPTDDAFAALPAGTVEDLLADIPALTDILTYHVVSGSVLAADVVTLSSAPTLLGQDVSVRIENGNVFINDSQVIITDIVGSNGVIHVIDAVLLPMAEEVVETPAETIVDIAVADGRFTTLVAALTAADLAGTLSGDGPFTVFAPTDDAFAALPAGTVEGLLADIPALTDILLYHVVSGNVLAADVVGLSSAPTLLGQDVSVRVENGNVFINESQVVITDITGTNGVIHVIDAVLLPMAEEVVETPAETIVDIAVADGRFTTLVAALQAAGLDTVLAGDGPFTVFAPTDEAFARLDSGTVEALLNDIPALTNILTYHVVSGEVDAATALTLPFAPTIQGSNIVIDNQFGNVVLNRDGFVTQPDVQASNGVIHVVNRVLLPPAPKVQAPVDAPSNTVVDIAIADGRFTTLVAALTAANLVGTLSGDGPFTVFAPTDDAFAALPAGTVEGLLADIPALTDILLYHVVSGNVLAADVVALSSAPTLLGQDVAVRVENGNVFINDSQVILTDIVGTNGVIHVIDEVLLP
jgi:transforming growth factor-beta-induced protein